MQERKPIGKKSDLTPTIIPPRLDPRTNLVAQGVVAVAPAEREDEYTQLTKNTTLEIGSIKIIETCAVCSGSGAGDGFRGTCDDCAGNGAEWHVVYLSDVLQKLGIEIDYGAFFLAAIDASKDKKERAKKEWKEDIPF